MSFASVLSALGLGPKTLPQATATLETAHTTFEAVDKLFVNAGLNLEAMLATGPDALKAHIASVSAKDGELAAAQAKIKELEAQASSYTLTINGVTEKLNAYNGFSATIGAKPDTKPDEFKALLDSHVKKQAALVLAQTGHAPVSEQASVGVGAVTAAPGPNATRDEHYRFLQTLPDKEQHPYFQKHLRTAK